MVTKETYKIMAYLFMAYSALTVMIGYLPVYFQANGFSETQIGWLMAVGPFATIFAQPFWGFLSDRYNTVKKILGLCAVMALFVSILFFQMTSLALLLVAGFFLFAFLAPCTALGDSLAHKHASRQEVSFGRIRMWGSIGFAITSLATGFVIEELGASWMLLPFTICIGIAFLVILRLKDVEPSSRSVTLIHAVKHGLRPKIIIFLVIMFFVSVGHRTNDSFLGLFIVEQGGGESLIGWAWFIGVISEALVLMLSYLWFRRFPALYFIIIAALLYAIRWLLMGYLATPEAVLWLQLLHGITFAFMYISALQYISKLMPEELQATGHLLFITTFFGVSGIAGSLGGGVLMEAVTGVGMYYVLGWLGLAGSFGLILFTLINERKAFYA